MNVNLFLPRNFLLATDIYYEQPERIIQKFIESVCLPGYYSGRMNQEEKLATSFFLEFQSRPNNRPYPAKRVREKYLDYESLVRESADQLEIVENRFELLDQFYAEWHYELVKNISKNDAVINQADRLELFGYKI